MGWQLVDAGSAAGMLHTELVGRGTHSGRASVRREEAASVAMGRGERVTGRRADGVSRWMGIEATGGGVIRRVELVKERGFPGAGSCGQCQHKTTGGESGSKEGAIEARETRETGRRGRRGHLGLGEGGTASSVDGGEGGDGRWRDLAWPADWEAIGACLVRTSLEDAQHRRQQGWRERTRVWGLWTEALQAPTAYIQVPVPVRAPCLSGARVKHGVLVWTFQSWADPWPFLVCQRLGQTHTHTHTPTYASAPLRFRGRCWRVDSRQ